MTNQTELTAERVERAIAIQQELMRDMRSDDVDEENRETAEEVAVIVETVVLPVLRAEQERLNPQPLTWEELSGMVGEPVWTIGEYCGLDGWDIIEEVYDDSVLFGRSTERPERWNYNLRELSGKLGACAWLAYRAKPEWSAE